MTDTTPEIRAIAESVGALIRTANRNRTRAIDRDKDKEGEWAALVLLRTLASDGPMRASVLAEHLAADPSTVSRQVATLVRDGLVERQADQEDGRASLLVPTGAGHALLRENATARDRRFAELLTDWKQSDVKTLARLLDRFADDYCTASATWFAAARPTVGAAR